MIADDRWVAVIADDRRVAMVANHDSSIAAVRTNRICQGRGRARPTGTGIGVDDLVRRAVISDDRRVAVVANDWPLTGRRNFDSGRR